MTLQLTPKQRSELLDEIFIVVNHAHFDGTLKVPELRWNSRLRSSAGRFSPGRRSFWLSPGPRIEIASYLLQEPDSRALIGDTLAHEMIHYWLWVRGRPFGHTSEFYCKMKEMGVSRYNPVPKRQPFRYLYGCPACLKDVYARRRLGTSACGACCKRFASGKYDSRFKLVLMKSLVHEKQSTAVEPGRL